MPKFNKRNDYNYTKPKFNNSYKKKNIQINTKGFHDIDDSSPSFKWLKVTCITSSQSCWNDILNKIENLCSRYTGRQVHLKACNVIYNDDMLEFYVKMKKSEIEYVIHNAYRIEHYRLKCYKNEDIHIPHEIPAHWIEVLKQALKGRYSINPSNNEAELNLSYFSEDKIIDENDLVLQFSSPRVFECVLNILKQELSELSKLNLSNNGIVSIYKLKSFVNSVKITRLDISNNKLSNLNELNCLENGSIVDLNISGNNFRKSNPHDLKKDVRKILPGLKFLNGMKLEESVVIAGETLKSSKSLPPVIFGVKNSDAFYFVLNLISKFDAKSRDELCDFYNSESVLTMATYGETLPYYKSNSTNIYINKDSIRRNENIKRGKAQILGALSNFPPTKHIEDSLNVDIISSHDEFIMVAVTGAFIELPTNKNGSYRVRGFSRTMIIVNGGIVLQDSIQLMSNDNNLYQKYRTTIDVMKEQMEFSKSHKDLENLSIQEIEIVRQFKEFSRMNVPTCLRFLKSFSDLASASEQFKKMQANGEIPIEAFRDE